MLREWVAVGVRILAIILVFWVVRGLAWLPYSATPDATFVITYAGLHVAMLLVAVGLWYFPMTIARYIVSWDEKPIEKNKLDPSQLELVGLVLLGVFFMLYVISDLTYWLIFMVAMNRSPQGMAGLDLEQISSIVTTFFELALASWLMFGAPSVASLLLRIRNLGK